MLDAIHLATALQARAALPDLALLSLDRRIRTCGEQLGFQVLPA
jgi:predicted nucleic acid-binding protein